ncbi:MAG: helix-turn-helix domain-containing protein [bacterium]
MPDAPAPRSPSLGYFAGGPRYHTTRANGDSNWLILVTRSGAGVLCSRNERVRLDGQSVAIYREGVAQDYATDRPPWTFAFAHIKPRAAWHRIVSNWPTVCDGTLVLPVRDEAAWAQTWAAMAWARQLAGMPVRRRDPLVANAIEAVLLWAEESNPASGLSPDARTQRAARFAAANCDRAVTAAEMARAAGLSTSRLNTLFREQFGESPVRFAERLRLERAGDLIVTAGLSVKEAAAAAGYDDPYHFSHRFSSRMGQPPSKWAQHAKGASPRRPPL